MLLLGGQDVANDAANDADELSARLRGAPETSGDEEETVRKKTRIGSRSGQLHRDVGRESRGLPGAIRGD